ncbi:MAG: glycosyltransferase [Patescibacteria group bacterium]
MQTETRQGHGRRVPTPGRLPPIIYPPTIDWHFLYQRPQQLMVALARLGYQVYFCNTAAGRSLRADVTRLAPNLFLVNGGPPPSAAGPGPILWVSYPPHVRLLDRFRPRLTVFDAVDAPAEEFAHWAPDVDLLRDRADLVFASSMALYEAHAGRHPHVHLCPNAADYAHFARAASGGEIPGDLARIPGPIVGFHGALATWIDWDLVAETAAANPDLSFVFVGPLYSGCERLPSGPNLHYLGHRDYRLLPNYIRGFNAAIIPFRQSTLTEACNPIKLWEYLAAGKPVVATPLPEVRQFREVLTASNPADFGRMLRLALAEKDPAAAAARQALARNNSWEARALFVHRILAAALARKSPV